MLTCITKRGFNEANYEGNLKLFWNFHLEVLFTGAHNTLAFFPNTHIFFKLAQFSTVFLMSGYLGNLKTLRENIVILIILALIFFMFFTQNK